MTLKPGWNWRMKQRPSGGSEFQKERWQMQTMQQVDTDLCSRFRRGELPEVQGEGSSNSKMRPPFLKLCSVKHLSVTADLSLRTFRNEIGERK